MNESLQATYILSENSLITDGPAVTSIAEVSATLPTDSHRNVSINVSAPSGEDVLCEPSITIEALPNDNLLSPGISIDEVCHTPSISADPSWPQEDALYMLEASEECEGLSDCDSTYFPSSSSTSKLLSLNGNVRNNIGAEATFKTDGHETKEIVFVPRNSNATSSISQSPEVRFVQSTQSNSKPLSSKELLNAGKNITFKHSASLLKSRHQLSSNAGEKISLGKRKYSSLPNSNNCALPAPPGTTYKIAPNATIIDLKKINRGRDTSKPIQLDQVAVTIDDKDKVKVIDFGHHGEEIWSSDFFASPVKSSKVSGATLSQLNIKKIKLGKKKASKELSDVDPESSAVEDVPDECEILTEQENSNEASFHQFEDESLLVAMENMRQLRVDCNVALVDPGRDYIVYAHRLVLVARSPYFYKNLYLRRKRLNFLHQFARFSLPHRLQYEAVEAVVSYMYTGNAEILLQCDTSEVLRVLRLFEMTSAAEQLATDMNTRLMVQPPEPRISSEIKSEPSDLDSKPTLMHSVSAREDSMEDRRRRRKVEAQRSASVNASTVPVGFMINAAGEEVRMKPPVAKLVESTLTPFLCKLEELFDPSSSTMQVARTSQHVITLWNAELLLTKLFDQNELTKYFTDFMNNVMEGASYRRDDVSSSYGNYVVETLSSVAGLDETYTRVGGSDSVVPEVEMLTVGDMQIINYTQMDPKHMPYFVRLISLYKFRIIIGNDKLGSNSHNNLGIVDPNSGQFQPIVQGLDGSSLSSDLTSVDKRKDEIVRQCFKRVSEDLSKRTIADLDVSLNSNYQEEMIMHIIVEQMESERVLPLCIGIFLAKGCSFCRKRECSSEDLTSPIGPNNPICPDRQCIKRNLVCPVCHKQMNNSKSLMRHKYSVHDVQSGDPGGMYICSHCGETFAKKWKLNVHEKQHEDRKLQIACNICNKVMRGSIALKKHINMVHEAKRQYKCEYCTKMFKRKETLMVHARIHTGEKPFACYHCDYSSETKGNLKAHTWRKHKRTLLATSVGTDGVETSITGPVTSTEGGVVEETVLASTDEGVEGDGTTAVLQGPVLELDEQVATDGDSEHTINASLVAHSHLQEGSFILS